jgi:hypothetical protein
MKKKSLISTLLLIVITGLMVTTLISCDKKGKNIGLQL